MPDKKKTNKKGGFSLVPITLSEPIKTTDGFTNLIDDASSESEQTTKDKKSGANAAKIKAEKTNPSKLTVDAKQAKQSKKSITDQKGKENFQNEIENQDESAIETERLTEAELLQILGADNLNEIYELTDVLRASSLKLYAALVRLADSQGRVRVKNHELMAEAGIKGIATLYKQERWLTQLKLVEKKAKPGPHDGSSYFIFKLESLPLPDEIYEKFDRYLFDLG